MLLETPRLTLTPYSADEWAAVAVADRRGRSWAVDYPTDGDVLLAQLGLLGRAPAPTGAAPWGPLQIRERVTGIAIGGAGFKGPPDGDGCVEVGYGLAPSAQGKGYASEAVRALCEMALASREPDRDGLAVPPGPTAVIAETHPGNVASERVLERCGFVVTSRTDGMTSWRWEPIAGAPPAS